MSSRPLLSLALNLQGHLEEFRKRGKIPLLGSGLNVAAVVAAARYDCLPIVEDEEVIARLNHSTEILHRTCNDGTQIYGELASSLRELATANHLRGVHTGFGGSADTRPDDQSAGGLGRGLMQLLQSGVLTADDLNLSGPLDRQGSMPYCMPLSWMKATNVVRINQCVRGHSAIRHETIQSLVDLAAAQIIPIVPLRGSVSASGDLMPLAYIAGTLEGSPDIYVTRGCGKSAEVLPAGVALAEIGMKPLRLSPREGLGLVNGTATSAATASLAVLDAIRLTLLSAGLTCLVSEGMAARVEWLHPFIAETRPHPGQREVADIMREFLRGSRLVAGLDDENDPQKNPLNVRPSGGLPQDRYPLRTSPQWLGPQFEDLLLAYSQITVELNSTTDNPLTNLQSGAMHHGGNFQATSITSAAEKIRSSLQMVGKLLFSQSTEMVNHQMNAGLPPNLAADDPSVSFCCKGLDISIAAYQSELSYLSNSMSNHVQSAEMHNQAVNSLAFLSTRYTMQAIELLGMMVAGVIYAACQAVDLRVMHATFLEAAATTLQTGITHLLPNGFTAKEVAASFSPAIRALQNAWWNNAALDAPERCSLGASTFVQVLCDPAKSELGAHLEDDLLDLSTKERRQLQNDIQELLCGTYQSHRATFLKKPPTKKYMGKGSKVIYLLVREELAIPMNRGLVDHPLPPYPGEPGSSEKRTIGSYVSRIYESIRDGKLFERFATACKELGLDDAGPNGVHHGTYVN